MGAIMFKYVQLLCVAFFMKNTNCAQITDVELVKNLKLSSLVAMCLQNDPSNKLESCYENLASRLSNVDEDIPLTFEDPNNSTDFHLYCRDASKLMLKVDHPMDVTNSNDEIDTYVYMLIVQESTGKFMDRVIYFSDEKLINVTMDDLSITSSLSYNITVYIISSNGTVQGLGTKMFTTLMEKYQPENITEIQLIKVDEYYDEVGNDLLMNLTIGWQPGRDRTCTYEVIIYSNSLDLETKPVPIDKLYEYTFTNLPYNEDYSISVRGVNSHDSNIYSREHWIVFPFSNDIDVTANCQHISDNLFDINVTWIRPYQNPAYYQIQIKDRYAFVDENSSTGIYEVEISGDSTSYFFSKIELQGPDFLLNITGFKENGDVLIFDHGILELYRMPPSKLMRNLFYASVGCMVLLVIVLFKIWKGRIDSFISLLAQKRIDDMDIEAVKSMSTGTVLELIAELTKDETMEVEKENITVLEQLGEGAFGLVKKGLIIRNGEKEYVAVKMIKNTSNLEDIKQFHQEITVMKSVGQHENIVSIVGHCTSDIKYLMLLTEYCDAGNLLDVLRLEFAKQLKFYDTKGKFSSFQKTLEKYPDSLLNFDMSESDKKEISYKNIGCSAIQHNLFVVNQMYDELNNNANNNSNGQMLKGIEMTATNALYLKLNNDTTKSATIIELSSVMGKDENEVNPVDDFLTSNDLLSFAKQICDGMDFLSRKKVVHRDLAARNILVCSNKTVKISDFGLSRDIYQDNFYRKTGNGKLPIKWLALESMTHQVYTSQSDVWSFGILLYEIVTLGAVPYSSISVENLLKVLRTGYRMERPNHCHILLYELMMLCWHTNPTDRPSFDELSGKLHNFLSMENTWGERIIDLQTMFNRCMSEMNYMKPLM